MNKTLKPMPHQDDRFKTAGRRQITNSRHLFPSEVRTIKHFIRFGLREKAAGHLESAEAWNCAAALVAQFARH